MKNLKFQHLPEKQPEYPMEGDMFLSDSLVSQKELKEPGDSITYYIITNVSDHGKRIEYVPIYDILEL